MDSVACVSGFPMGINVVKFGKPRNISWSGIPEVVETKFGLDFAAITQ